MNTPESLASFNPPFDPGVIIRIIPIDPSLKPNQLIYTTVLSCTFRANDKGQVMQGFEMTCPLAGANIYAKDGIFYQLRTNPVIKVPANPADKCILVGEFVRRYERSPREDESFPILQIKVITQLTKKIKPLLSPPK